MKEFSEILNGLDNLQIYSCVVLYFNAFYDIINEKSYYRKVVQLMSVKLKLYNKLINRNRTVKHHYEHYVASHESLHAKAPVISWGFAVLLNIKYSLLHFPDKEIKPKQKAGNESGTSFRMTADETADLLCTADVVSFDVFDTLILRPFASPADLFYVIGEKLGIPDFRTVRKKCESDARKIKQQKENSNEVTLGDIYELVAHRTGISAEYGMKTEYETELSLCRANPFMLEVYKKVLAKGKTVIITTDMYMPGEFFTALLHKNGFDGYDRIFLSCESGCGKSDGRLYKLIKEQYGKEKRYIHIGDNRHSDISNAEKHGFKTVYYPNINNFARDFRPHDMSYIIGSVYSALVNERLYCRKPCSSIYEYGYKCGGILVLGYCNFIYKTAKSKNIDKVLFFARDGYILKKIFDRLYPDVKTEYVYWSRTAATKLCADIFPFDYVRRFIEQKTGRNYTFEEIFSAMELSCKDFSLIPGEILTNGNLHRVQEAVYNNIPHITSCYADMYKSAEMYFKKITEGSKNLLTVDCGWAGSGSIMLDALLNRKFCMNVNVIGVLAGTNTKYQLDSDFSETYLADGKLLPYCFSSALNRRYYENHHPDMKHNIYFELLFGAPHPSFLGFGSDGELKFDVECENEQLVKDIHSGEEDFINDYLEVCGKISYIGDISGSDAYAPFAAAISDGKYLSGVFADSVFDDTASGRKTKI